MEEDLHIRRRNVMRHHFTMTSNVLLFGYRGVSDSAKMTYLVVDAYDWPDASGTRKGYAAPSLPHLATVRGVDCRTVRRHLAELERAGLLTRRDRPGKPSLLIIEEASKQESQAYLGRFSPDWLNGTVVDNSITPDKNVRPPRTKMSAPSIQRKRSQEKEANNVIDKVETSKGGDLNSIGSIIATARSSYQRGAKVATPSDALAQEIAAEFGDWKSLAYYRGLTARHPAHRVREAIGLVRAAARDGQIRTRRAALFVAILRGPPRNVDQTLALR